MADHSLTVGDTMIVYVYNRDIFSHLPGTKIVVPVNTIGVMGAGLAYQFRVRFPRAAQSYIKACRTGIEPGDLVITKPAIFFPTKRHYKNPSELGFIEQGLDTLRRFVQTVPQPASYAIPRLGCGLGGLQWPPVHRLIYDRLHDMPGVYYIHGEDVL